jgi:hypothetical protein
VEVGKLVFDDVGKEGTEFFDELHGQIVRFPNMLPRIPKPGKKRLLRSIQESV